MKRKEEINIFLTQIFNNILKLEESYIRSQQTKDYQFSVTEAHIIEKIGLPGKRRMSEVAEDLRITISSLTLAIDRMERKNFVKRVKDEKDKRAVLLCLTEKGEEVFHIHDEFHRKMTDAIDQFFPTEDDDMIFAFIAKVSNFFQMLVDREEEKGSVPAL